MLVVACSGVIAEEPAEVYHLEDSSRFGRPTRIVPPSYPPEALARHVTGFVDMLGHVTPLLSFERISYTPGTPEAAIFIEPLKEVVSHWQFRPVFGNGCFPTDDPVKLRVEFEIENEKPKIGVIVARADQPRAPPIEVLRRVDLRYPSAAQKAGVQASVYVRLDVDPEGLVSNVQAQAYPHDSTDAYRAFERESQHAFGGWRFGPLPVGDTHRRIVCYNVMFMFKD